MEFLKISQKENFTETQNLFCLGTLMEAGSDTSRVSIGQIIAGAATYPDWVVRARAELDAVCGHNAERLPGWEDRDKLPYIAAVVKEGFRWRPNIAEIGAPTSLIQDDEYEGYKFPKGTVFTWNAWAIALSEKEYPQAERFWPDLFLNADLDNPLKGHWAFGAGRRVCVGWKVGEMNVWIAIARLLYCFDFTEDPVRIPFDASESAIFLTPKIESQDRHDDYTANYEEHRALPRDDHSAQRCPRCACGEGMCGCCDDEILDACHCVGWLTGVCDEGACDDLVDEG